MIQQPEDEGIGELLGRLVEDGKGYAQAEIGYYRTLARSKLRDATAMLWMGATALVLAFVALVALAVGLVLTLSSLVGPGWATLIVFTGITAIAAILGWLAWTHVKRMMGQKS
ncbi:phage holin family protein [Sphingomonas sp.]|uniref:phage holin family protein n=1 Tax=Sphingomonas sp. TaxID=28214 RepID=UPI002ED9D0C4